MATDQTLVELVRTLAVSFEDLSKLVEGMPARLDAKLTQVRQDYTTLAASLEQQMEGLKADAADIRGTLNSTLGAIRTEVGDVQHAFAAIIGDNRREIDESIAKLTDTVGLFEGRLGEVTANIEKITATGNEAILTLRNEVTNGDTELRNQLDSQHTFIQNVRTACDPQDLYAGITKLTARAEETEKRLEVVVETGTTLRGLIELNEKKLGERIDDSQAALGQAHLEFANQFEGISLRVTELAENVSTVRTDADKLVADVASHITMVGDNFKGTEASMESLRQDLRTVGTQVKDLSALHEEATAALRHTTETDTKWKSLVEETLDDIRGNVNAVRTVAAEQVGTLRQETQTRIVEMNHSIVSRIGELATDVAALATMRGTVDELATARYATQTTVQQMQETATRQAETLDTASQQVLTLVEDLSTTRTLLEAINSRVTELGDETTNRLNGITEELAGHASTESVEQAVKSVTEQIEQVVQRFGIGIAELETKMRGALDANTESWIAANGNLANVVEEVRAAIPGVFDPLPLRAELQAWLGEQFQQHKEQLPKVDFEVTTEKGELLLSFTHGERTVQRKVPLGVGIEYRGVYDREEDYETGNFVTHKGSMWYAQQKPTGEPGKDHDGWKLAVKCGRDGKDATPARIKHVRDPATGLIQESRLGYDDDDQH